jgi:hypothetical protein
MPGLGLKNFGSEVLTSNDVDGYLMQQTVMVFASSAARTTAFTAASLSPSEGMVSYLQDTNEVQVYNGSSWVQMVNATAESVSVDSTGRMLRPSMPVACTYRTSSLATGNFISWSGSFINVGSMWNGSTRFTVPIAGRYGFAVQLMSDNQTGAVYVDLYKNNGRVDFIRAYGYNSTGTSHKNVKFHVIVSAAANDYFEFRLDGGNAMYGDGAGYSNALVYLYS